MALVRDGYYTLYFGKMAEAQKLYTELGFPALKKDFHKKRLVVESQGNLGALTTEKESEGQAPVSQTSCRRITW